MFKLIKTEPAILVALVGAVIAVAVAFGLKLEPAQNAAIMALVTMGVGIVTRSRVTPVPPVVP